MITNLRVFISQILRFLSLTVHKTLDEEKGAKLPETTSDAANALRCKMFLNKYLLLLYSISCPDF